VTGAASGIGRACVGRLHREGANVVAVDLDEQQVTSVLDELGDHGRLLAAAVDVADVDRVEALVDTTIETTIERFAGVEARLASAVRAYGKRSQVLLRSANGDQPIVSAHRCSAAAGGAKGVGRHRSNRRRDG
jgi:NAD(P)-dependent dehydrogenase (short-subunit alcohol dehydrogenase family)